MRRGILIALSAISILFAAGCETTPVKDEGDEAPVEDRAAVTSEQEAEAAQTRRLKATSRFKGDALDDPSSPLSRKVIYFDFDSSEILDDYRPVVEAHAAYLADNPRTTVMLEGHTDERGSREYNLGLGERRGKSVRRMLVLLGATERQLDTVSYGEERPAKDGNDESAWQYNRRVEILYQVR